MGEEFALLNDLAAKWAWEGEKGPGEKNLVLFNHQEAEWNISMKGKKKK